MGWRGQSWTALEKNMNSKSGLKERWVTFVNTAKKQGRLSSYSTKVDGRSTPSTTLSIKNGGRLKPEISDLSQVAMGLRGPGISIRVLATLFLR